MLGAPTGMLMPLTGKVQLTVSSGRSVTELADGDSDPVDTVTDCEGGASSFVHTAKISPAVIALPFSASFFRNAIKEEVCVLSDSSSFGVGFS